MPHIVYVNTPLEIHSSGRDSESLEAFRAFEAYLEASSLSTIYSEGELTTPSDEAEYWADVEDAQELSGIDAETKHWSPKQDCSSELPTISVTMTATATSDAQNDDLIDQFCGTVDAVCCNPSTKEPDVAEPNKEVNSPPVNTSTNSHGQHRSLPLPVDERSKQSYRQMPRPVQRDPSVLPAVEIKASFDDDGVGGAGAGGTDDGEASVETDSYADEMEEGNASVCSDSHASSMKRRRRKVGYVCLLWLLLVVGTIAAIVGFNKSQAESSSVSKAVDGVSGGIGTDNGGPVTDPTGGHQGAGGDGDSQDSTESPDANGGQDGTVSPDGTQTPGDDGTEAPDSDGTEAPGGDGTEAPDGDGTEAPDGDGTEAPDGDGTDAPDGDGTEAPDGTTGTEEPSEEPCTDDIATDKSCYLYWRETIEVNFQVCDAKGRDWVAFYPIGSDPSNLGPPLYGWSYSCGNTFCGSTLASHTFDMPYALPPGQFQAYLIRYQESPPFEAVAVSDAFEVSLSSCA